MPVRRGKPSTYKQTHVHTERERHTHLMAALAATLVALPAGWAITPRDAVTDPPLLAAATPEVATVAEFGATLLLGPEVVVALVVGAR